MTYEWMQGNKHHGVRYFDATNKLVWSSWYETPNGPAYDDGISQTIGEFAENGIPEGLEPPSDILEALQKIIYQDQRKKRGLFSWLKRKS